MMTQTDLFAPAAEIDRTVVIECEAHEASARSTPIAIPCGFRNRHNSPFQRLGNWPVMMDGKQMACRDRPMVHCDPACFKGGVVGHPGQDNDSDVIWGEEVRDYDDEE